MHSNTRGNYYMIFLLVYSVVVSFIFGTLSLKYKYLITDKSISIVLLLILSQLLINIVPFFLYLLVTRKKIKDILSFKLLSMKNIVLITLICFFIQPIMMLLSFITTLFSSNEVSDLLNDLTSLPFYISLFGVAVMPAICEEITFRGIILSEYKNMPLKSTFFINGLFFGIMHLTVQQFLYATLLGIIFSYFVYYTKSILSSMLGHFVINGSQVFLVYMTANTNVEPEILSTDIIFPTIALIAVLILITCPILRLLFKAFKKHNMNNAIISEIEYLPDDIAKDSDTYNNKKIKIYNLSFWIVVLLYVFYMLFF